MRLKFTHISFVLSLFGASLSAQAQGVQCQDLFPKSYKVSEFVISAAKKDSSVQYLEAAHRNLLENHDPAAIFALVRKIEKEGLDTLTPEEKKSIVKFRQDSSFLRSVFQSASKAHISPSDFAQFVRDFGVLKDYLLMDNHFGAKLMAKKIRKKHSELDFTTLLDDAKPASKKSVRAYFKGLLKTTKAIMAKPIMTVDEVHDVRKNLRDILRYMQIQQEVSLADSKKAGLDLSQGERAHDSEQIDFLKKTNSRLGEICDQYAAEILKNQMTKHSLVEFPEKIRERVEYFLLHYQIQIEP